MPVKEPGPERRGRHIQPVADAVQGPGQGFCGLGRLKPLLKGQKALVFCNCNLQAALRRIENQFQAGAVIGRHLINRQTSLKVARTISPTSNTSPTRVA